MSLLLLIGVGGVYVGPTGTGPGQFAIPFFLGGNSVVISGPSESGGTEEALPNTVTLDGFTFPVELTDWRSGPQDTFRDGVVANDEPNDSLFNARGAWARYRYSWHHGQGQDLGDLDAGADPFRFQTSYGLAWNTKYQLSLTRATSLNRTSASSGLILVRSGIYVFLGSGVDLYRTSDLTTWTLLTAPGGTIQGLTSDGSDLYVATSTGAVKYVGSATVSTAFATPVVGDCSSIAFLANRLVLSKANVLYEVAGTGALTTIKTHFQAAFRWTTLFNIGSRMYIGGFAGSRTELYTVSTDSAGVLVQSQEAAPFPTGELLRTGVAVAGSVMLCTSNGIRMAQVSGDGTLTYGPLISGPGDVRCATSDGRHGYFGWSVIDTARSGIGRLVLDDEVGVLQPAYGTDVFEASVSAVVSGVVRLNGRTAFAVDGSGVWVESATAYVGQGVVTSGRISFGTVEPKALIGLKLAFTPLTAGQSISAIVFDNNNVNIGSGITATVGASTLDIDLGGEQMPYLSVTVTLGGNGSTTPVLQSWRIRGYPVPPPVLQWVLPLIVHEIVTIDAGQGRPMTIVLNDVYDWIEELWSARRYTVLRMGTREYRVRVDNFEWRPRKWTDDGALPQGLLVVQLVDA